MNLRDAFAGTAGAGPPGSAPAPDPPQRSTLPPGGSDWEDFTFHDWAGTFARDWDARIRAALPPDRPGPRYIFTRFRLVGHLHKWLIGWTFPQGTGPTYSHRLRFVAIQFTHRRDELIAEAGRYAGRIRDALVAGPSEDR